MVKRCLSCINLEPAARLLDLRGMDYFQRQIPLGECGDLALLFLVLMPKKLPVNGLMELLVPEAINIRLHANSKEGVLRELCEVLFSAGFVTDPSIVLAAVLAREQAGSTGCGCGVAVPHARMQDIDRTILTLGISQSGIEFGASDSLPVKIFFLLIGPQKAPEEYLKLLSQIVQLIKEEDFRNALLSCESTSEVIELFRSA